MRALFAVDSPHESNLPPMDELQYTDPSTGELCGGWWIGTGEAPSPTTVLVCVDTTDAMLDTMADNPAYLYLGDVP